MCSRIASRGAPLQHNFTQLSKTCTRFVNPFIFSFPISTDLRTIQENLIVAIGDHSNAGSHGSKEKKLKTQEAVGASNTNAPESRNHSDKCAGCARDREPMMLLITKVIVPVLSLLCSSLVGCRFIEIMMANTSLRPVLLHRVSVDIQCVSPQL